MKFCHLVLIALMGSLMFFISAQGQASSPASTITAAEFDELMFRAMFGLPSNDKNAKLVVASHLGALEYSTCTWVTRAHKNPEDLMWQAHEKAWVESLRAELEVAQKKGFGLKSAESFLQLYMKSVREGGVFTCSAE